MSASRSNGFLYINCPYFGGRTGVTKENIEKHIPEFDKSKHVFACERFNTQNVHMIERSGRVMRNYLKRWGAINEILTPVYNQRLVFDLDFKKEDYPEPLKVEDVDKILNLLASLGKALNTSYRIAGYGENEQKEIDELIKSNKYKFVYEENHKTEKVFSIHALYDVIGTAQQFVDIFPGGSYLSHDGFEVELDTSIYSNTNHLLRLPFSKKVKKDEIVETAINSIPEKDYKKWLVCVDNGDEDIDEDKLEILKQWVVIKKKENQQNNNADDKRDNATTQQVIEANDKKPAKSRKYNGPSIDEPNIKLPTGLIYEILKLYPLRKLTDIMFLKENDDNYIYWSALNNFIRSCPYEYEELKDVLYCAYNRNTEHDNPDMLNTYAKSYIGKGTVSNQYFLELIKPFKREVSFADYLDENKFDIEEFERSKNIKLNKVSKTQRESIKYLREERKRLREEFIEKYGNNEIYRKYKRILNVFRVFETPYVEGSRFNHYFDDSRKMEFQFKRQYTDEFSTCSKDNIHLIDSSADINKILITSKAEYEKLKQKYLFINDANMKNGQRLLDIFKTGFVHEYDFNVYMDFIRSKLLNPKNLYIKNFVCYEGRDSLKTAFINMLSDYVGVGIVPVNLIHSQFNGFMANPICVYEELPASIKESRTVMEQLKAMTSTKNISLHVKGKDSETRKNYCNIIINTNHKEVGGLFDNQAENEMFKRFYIIEKQTIDRQLINEFFEITDNIANVAACFEIVKQLTPLSIDDINDTRTQENYYSFVRNTQNNKQCLTIGDIDRTITKDDEGRVWLRITELNKALKYYEITTSKEAERQQLEKAGIIKTYKNGRFQILDLKKYFTRYYKDETPDDTKELNEHLACYGVNIENEAIPGNPEM